MKYIKLGNAGLDVSKICLGMMLTADTRVRPSLKSVSSTDA